MDKSSNGIAQTEMAFTVPAACFTVEGLLIQRTYLVAVRLTISKSSYDLLLPVHVPVRIVLQNKKKAPYYSLSTRHATWREENFQGAIRATLRLHGGRPSTLDRPLLRPEQISPYIPDIVGNFFFFFRSEA
jgi:hypothetical protein